MLQPDSSIAPDSSILTPLSLPTPPAQYFSSFLDSTERIPRIRPQRSYSHSTIEENLTSLHDSDVGAFKIVIDRPGTRAKTAIPGNGVPALEVPIPSYKLGTPRFSVRGTAFMRNSSHTFTDDVRSSIFSGTNTSYREQSSNRATRTLSRRHSDNSQQPALPALPSPNPYDLASLPSPRIVRRHVQATPEMFDSLTFKPGCDHPSVVRYSGSGAIRAATPARLVAEITSPTFVDYDLLSDFFLTFRTFLDTSDLLGMLFARLKWALSRSDETGTIVRVRTFVAMRHWILNYFLDDFVVDYDLRRKFCDCVNNFVDDKTADQMRTKVPLKIIGELKKCWRRVCALYWDGPEFNVELGADVEIVPGGVAGSRNARLDPSFWHNKKDDTPKLDGIIEPDFVESEGVAISRGNAPYFADVSRAGHIGDITITQPISEQTPAHPEPPLSPTSVFSDHVVSCSFPFRNRHVEGSKALGAHPIDPSSVYDNTAVTTAVPKATPGPRVRPNHAHKRSGSFSDSFRDIRQQQQQPVQKVIYKSTEILLALPYAGSLVRGNLFPPGQAFVDVVLPATPSDSYSSATSLPRLSDVHKNPSAMSGPGMKKLLGSVRRVLSTRNATLANSSPTHGSFPHIPPLGVRGATINRLPGTAVVPQAIPRYVRGQAPTRIDILGAGVAEDFKRAVQEDADAEMETSKGHNAGTSSSANSLHIQATPYSMLGAEISAEPLSPAPQRRDITSEVTTGSKSIVIVDDTVPNDITFMTGALPANNSGDSLTGGYMLASGDPTPPSTPPDVSLGMARRSSHLLGQHTKRRSQSVDAPRSLGLNAETPHLEKETHHMVLQSRPSLTSRGTPQKIKKSISLRRYASFQSGFTQHQSELSFDATTLSHQPDRESSANVSAIPYPLRVLRRRPGGDLRAVNNVEDFGPLRRTVSTGSLGTFTDSVRSSFANHDSVSYVQVSKDDANSMSNGAARFSLGALAEAPQKRPLSLFSTHSSQPVMRPSFEKEARFLAQIPDDADDDGGVESALLKLEGKFEKRQSDLSTDHQNKSIGDFGGNGNSFGIVPHEMSTLTLPDDEEEKGEILKSRHEHAIDQGAIPTSTPAAVSYRPQPQTLADLKPTVYQPRGMRPASPPRNSIESYNSVPLLDRGLTDDEHDIPQGDWKEHSILHVPSRERQDPSILTPDSSHPNSFNFLDEADSMKDAISGHGAMSIDHSFLDDASMVSDLSSEISVEALPSPEYVDHDLTSYDVLPGLGIDASVKELSVTAYPVRQPSSPTIPMSDNSKVVSDDFLHAQLRDINTSDQRLPPSPQTTPTGLALPVNRVVSPSFDPLRANGLAEPSRKTSVHLPFIVAFDSQVLAQQFTLIEKDALNEIDWKDLIDMRWKDRGNIDSRSWVDFLRTSDPHGVEVVAARFNIMVKWAISELVLTHDLSERVRSIVKYIHIAQQCRRYRNFATMTQIAVALTAKDVARLTDTWAHVPANDLRAFQELEILISPTSNFHALRAEMEGSGAEQGCIPFVGLYTHDLLMNQERPSQIASTPTTDPLTNFDRCRTDAAIIKTLLRLLEASQLYRFQPIEGITERCLWMAALSDEEITKHSEWIQPA